MKNNKKLRLGYTTGSCAAGAAAAASKMLLTGKRVEQQELMTPKGMALCLQILDISQEEQQMARDYLWDSRTPKEKLYQSFIALAMRSAAKYCIIPMQDWLGLGNDCRINTPSTVGTNWRWRLEKSQLTPLLGQQIRSAALRYGRMNWN